MEELALEMEQQRLRLHASLAEAERSVRQERERAAEEMASLRARHKVEVEKVVGERAMAQADSRMGRLNSQVQSQQVGLMMVMINDDDDNDGDIDDGDDG